MGATLPFVVKASTRGGHSGASECCTGSNTTGAIAGAVVAGLWSFPCMACGSRSSWRLRSTGLRR